MKYAYLLIGLLILAGIGWFVFGRAHTATAPAETASSTGEAPAAGTAYAIDPSASTVTFAGTKPLIPNYVDSGTIGIQSGTLTVNGASGTGSIVMDMGSVHVGATGRGDAAAGPLEAKLKSSDFFDTATYPTATFAITNVAARADTASSSTYDVTGTLTMKGKTNDVTFPAKIVLEDGKLHATASFTIDRTKWGIIFGSKDFFSNLANNVISNDVKLTINAVANPQ